ncbi:MAG: DbpA RNA binding domain-containing protein, partial [Muribaculaceae bacterium]|nr:DbpA RNA binding domain-containing protein [Muribaculaceae bacterium]
GIPAGDIGSIDVRDHYALAAVPREHAASVLRRVRDVKVKGRKIRISLLK